MEIKKLAEKLRAEGFGEAYVKEIVRQKTLIAKGHCPACCGKPKKAPYQGKLGVYECAKCGAVYGQCYLGESYELVKPFFEEGEYAPEEQRYFELECFGSEGVTRRHGWFLPKTGRTTQIG